MAKPQKCSKKKIVIRGKRGGIKAEFIGHSGPGCPPRKKPSTRHLSRFKATFARQAKACKGQKLGAFRKCMSRLKHTMA